MCLTLWNIICEDGKKQRDENEKKKNKHFLEKFESSSIIVEVAVAFNKYTKYSNLIKGRSCYSSKLCGAQ